MSAPPIGELRIIQDGEGPLDRIALDTGATCLWTATDPADGFSQDFWVNPDGSTVVRRCGEGSLAVSPSGDHVLVGNVPPAVAVQLVTTYAVAPAAQASGALVLHGCAAERDGVGVVICAESGVGKSSLLVALTQAGWSPITEDLCAIETGPPTPLVWPGPPWVRLSPSNPAPPGWVELFQSRDKVGWDLGSGRTTAPVPLIHLILLERATEGTDPTETAPIRPPELIAALADHTPWFRESHLRPSAVFGPTAALAVALPATRVRLQRSAGWRAEAVALVESLVGVGR
jgi:hypothetical protein